MNIDKIIGSGLTSHANREKLIDELKKLGIKNSEVMNLISHMPRHLFIDTALANRAYENVSLPIGFKQTISQPYMVARMTELIHETDSMDNVLEIGTGSGYQTSILSMLFKKVTTIERISSLHEKSKNNLPRLGFKNISFVLGDGHLGYLPNSPYDAVIITAAAESIPENLISQISKKGRIVLPLIDKKNQKLVKLKNTKNGIVKKIIEDVFFVPLLPGIETNE
jgi:protein-L-isoaspartate(D-aspartate) O-methyltransferase